MFVRAKKWVELARETRAVTALEYGLIAGVLVITMLVGFNFLGRKMQNSVQRCRQQAERDVTDFAASSGFRRAFRKKSVTALEYSIIARPCGRIAKSRA